MMLYQQSIRETYLRSINRDAAGMLPGRARREQAILYGVLGGTPRFLAAVQPDDTLASTVTEYILNPRGEVHLQLEHLIEQERGIREPAEYRATLAAVADGGTDLAEVARRAGLADREHVVRRALNALEQLELVRRERNFDASPKAAFQYRIADPAVRFWYRFVHAYRSQLEQGELASVWRHRVEPLLNDYMGKVFEDIVRDAYVRRHDAWKLPAATRWARWEGRDRNRRSIELDLVARLDDGRLLVGEIKWSSRPIGPSVHAGVLRNLEDLARSGQGWAHDALSPATSAGQLYVSAGGFTDEFKALARAERGIRLVTLEELYE